MKRIENREILQQVRKETSEKIEKSRCRIFLFSDTYFANYIHVRRFRGDL